MKRQVQHWIMLALVSTWASSSQAEDNTTTTFSSGGSTNLGGALTIGSTGTNNTLLISNGSSVTNTLGKIGDGVGASNNYATVTGSGSSWFNNNVGGYSLYVGKSGSFNTLVISNGALLNGGGAVTHIGDAAASVGNSVTVTGNGSVWTNVNVVRVGGEFGSKTNRLTISNGGKVQVGTIELGTYGAGKANLLEILNGGKLLTAEGTLANVAGSSGHQVIVSGTASSWTNIGNLGIRIGNDGTANSLIVTNGGKVFNSANSTGFSYLGFNATASNNFLRVTGAGSLFEDQFGLTVGNSGSSNALLIASGGTVRVAANTAAQYGLIIGANSGSANNLVQIDGGNLNATNNTTGNQYVDVRRGTLRLNSGTIDTERLFATNGASSVVEFNGGTLVTRGTTVSNGSALVVGNGTSAATLRLKGGTHSFADGLTVSTGARLEGNGTVQGNASVDGTLAPGESPGQVFIVGNLSLSSTATYEVQLNGTTPGTLYDQTDVTGGVSLGNSTLSLSLGFSPVTSNQFTIINNDLVDAVSGTFNGLPEGSSVFVGGINEFKISYVGGTGNDVVLTFLVPEPNSACLLGIGGLVLLQRRRKRAAE